MIPIGDTGGPQEAAAAGAVNVALITGCYSGSAEPGTLIQVLRLIVGETMAGGLRGCAPVWRPCYLALTGASLSVIYTCRWGEESRLECSFLIITHREEEERQAREHKDGILARITRVIILLECFVDAINRGILKSSTACLPADMKL